MRGGARARRHTCRGSLLSLQRHARAVGSVEQGSFGCKNGIINAAAVLYCVGTIGHDCLAMQLKAKRIAKRGDTR